MLVGVKRWNKAEKYKVTVTTISGRSAFIEFTYIVCGPSTIIDYPKDLNLEMIQASSKAVDLFQLDEYIQIHNGNCRPFDYNATIAGQGSNIIELDGKNLRVHLDHTLMMKPYTFTITVFGFKDFEGATIKSDTKTIKYTICGVPDQLITSNLPEI